MVFGMLGYQFRRGRLMGATAVMNGYLAGQPMLATPQPFIDEMQRAPLKAGGKEFTNHFHLIDDGSGWKIISKLFTQNPPKAPQPLPGAGPPFAAGPAASVAVPPAAGNGAPSQNAAATAQASRP